MDPTVATIMTHEVDTAHEDTSMFQVAKQVSTNDRRHLVVVNDAGSPTGVFSQRDLYLELARSLNGNKRPGETTLKEMQRRTLITVEADASLAQAASLLEEFKIGCLPVVDSRDALIGIVSVVDVLRHVANSSDKAAESTAEEEESVKGVRTEDTSPDPAVDADVRKALETETK